MEHIIWSNIDLDINEWFFDGDIEDEEEKYRMMMDLNSEYLYDERANLDKDLGSEIIVIGDIGLWNGTVSGYKIIKSGNIKDCLYDDMCEYCKWYVDDENEFKFTGYHHDGRNYYTYRKIKNDIDRDRLEDFLEKLVQSGVTSNEVYEFTDKIGNEIKEIYGW